MGVAGAGVGAGVDVDEGAGVEVDEGAGADADEDEAAGSGFFHGTCTFDVIKGKPLKF